MDVVQKSAEHHFLAYLQELKTQSKGWAALRFCLSRNLDHRDLVSDPSRIVKKLDQFQKDSEKFFRELVAKTSFVEEGTAYLFEDGDIVLLAHLNALRGQKRLQGLFDEMQVQFPEGLAEYSALSRDIFFYEDFADKKFISVKKMQAYRQMADSYKVSSVPLRRARRDHPMILMVEDDRFTAAYAVNILGSDYDIVLARSGEEAISAYIEHAPDAVFLDVHLPGLSGHQTLEAIKTIDPEAFAVMLSVDSVRKNVEEASGRGAYSFLKKPFSKERLQAMTRHSPYVRASKRRIVNA